MRAEATEIDHVVSDDEGLSYIYVTWGEQGSYIDITKSDDEDGIYCELFDQSNGRTLKTITYELCDQLLTISVENPESLAPPLALTQIQLDLAGVEYDNAELSETLHFIFSS
jgi:hypothetical protein